MTQAMDRRLVVGVVQSPEEVADCPHLAERGTFVGIDHPLAGDLRYAGPGFLIDGRNPMAGRPSRTAAGGAQRGGFRRRAGTHRRTDFEARLRAG